MNLEYFLINIIFFLVVFFLVFIIDFYFISKSRKGKKKTEKLTSEGSYLISRFKLDEKKINLKKLNFHIAIINAFIISFVATSVSIAKLKIYFQLAIAFVMLFALIYSIYEIYGRWAKKYWGEDSEK